MLQGEDTDEDLLHVPGHEWDLLMTSTCSPVLMSTYITLLVCSGLFTCMFADETTADIILKNGRVGLKNINFSFGVTLAGSVCKRVKMSSFFSEQQKRNARCVVLKQNVILCAYPMITHSIYCFFLCKQCLSHNGKFPKQ